MNLKPFVLSFSLVILAQAAAWAQGTPQSRCLGRETRDLDSVIARLSCGGKQDGFRLSNRGSNAMLPTQLLKGENAVRQYSFNYPAQSLHDTHLQILDAIDVGEDTRMRITKFYFFPRVQLPTLTQTDENTLQVTLPNAETVDFDSHTGEIKSGVLRERVMTLTPNVLKYPRVYYRTGREAPTVVLKKNVRYAKVDEHRNFAVVTQFVQGQITHECKIPNDELFLATNEFRFESDADFDAYLQAHCQFGFLE